MYKETKRNSCKCLQLKSTCSHYLFNPILLCDFIAILNFIYFYGPQGHPYNCLPRVESSSETNTASWYSNTRFS